MEANRYKLAFLAAALFFFAGAMEMAVGLTSKWHTHIAFVALGAIFAGCGGLWLSIGIRWKRAAATSQT